MAPPPATWSDATCFRITVDHRASSAFKALSVYCPTILRGPRRVTFASCTTRRQRRHRTAGAIATGNEQALFTTTPSNNEINPRPELSLGRADHADADRIGSVAGRQIAVARYRAILKSAPIQLGESRSWQNEGTRGAELTSRRASTCAPAVRSRTRRWGEMTKQSQPEKGGDFDAGCGVRDEVQPSGSA